MGHPRAKLSVEGRRLAVRRVLQEGWAPARVAEAQGCSAATVYKWVARFKAEGDHGLHDRSSRPHHSPRRLHSDRELAILERRRTMIEGPHRIAWALGEAQSTVHRVLRRNGVPRLADIDRPTRIVVRYERERPGELLHVDVKKQGRIPDGGGWRVRGREGCDHRRCATGYGYDYLHVAIDDRTRIAYVEALADERRETAASFMVRALGWFSSIGVSIERVMTDNGACYRSTPFREVLAGSGIAHKRTRPYRPQTNGKVERLNLTLKWEWAYARSYSSNRQRLDALQAWVHQYNHHRPHMAHGGGSPMSALNDVSGNYT